MPTVPSKIAVPVLILVIAGIGLALAYAQDPFSDTESSPGEDDANVTEPTRSLHISLDGDRGIGLATIDAQGPVDATLEVGYEDTPAMDALLFLGGRGAEPVIPFWDREVSAPAVAGPAPAGPLTQEAVWSAEEGSLEGREELNISLRANASEPILHVGAGLRAGVDAEMWVNVTGPAEVETQRIEQSAILLNTTDLEGDQILTTEEGPTHIEEGTWFLAREGAWTMTLMALMDEGEAEVCIEGAPVACIDVVPSGSEIGRYCRYPAFDLPADVVVDARSDGEARFYSLLLPSFHDEAPAEAPIEPDCEPIDPSEAPARDSPRNGSRSVPSPDASVRR